MAAEGLLQTCTPPGNAAGSAGEAGAQGERQLHAHFSDGAQTLGARHFLGSPHRSKNC